MYSPNFNFYTIWSNIAFYSVLLIYSLFGKFLPAELLYAFIINMIIVGIMGNVIITFKIKNILEQYGSDQQTVKEVLMLNLFLHVVPLVLAFFVIQCMPARKVNYFCTTAIILVFILIWCLVPDQGKTFKQKIDVNYGNPGVGYYIAFFILLILISVFVKYNKVLCSMK
jgi:hypothetical protein